MTTDGDTPGGGGAGDLQTSYGGQYIARCDGDVIASARSYGALIELLDREAARDDRRPATTIEYVDTPDSLAIY